MKYLKIFFLALMPLFISCEKTSDDSSDAQEVYVLDKVKEISVMVMPQGGYKLGAVLSGRGYDLTLYFMTEFFTVTDGEYSHVENLGTAGDCSVNLNDGRTDMPVRSAKVSVTSSDGVYSFIIDISSTYDYRFTFDGAIDFRSAAGSHMTGRIERDRKIRSSAMGRDMKYSVYLPGSYDGEKEYPVLYLLHGYGDDNNAWIDKGLLADAIDEYERDGGRDMIVVCPDGLTTFYYDGWGTPYETYFFTELVPEIESEYKAVSDGGWRAVAGLSMGGYGSLYYALKYPEDFCYSYACSAAIDVGMGPSLYTLAKKADPSVVPGITLEMGNDDWVTGNGADFHDALDEAGIAHEYITRSGSHEWGFWQVCLPKILTRCGEAYAE